MMIRIKEAVKKATEEFKGGFRIGFMRSAKLKATKENSSNVGIITNHVQYKDSTIPVIYCPENVQENGAFCTVNVFEGEYRIVIDDNYLMMSEPVQQFMIHQALGVLNSLPNNRTLEDAFKADKYAAEQVGIKQAIEALACIWIVACSDMELLPKCLSIPCRLKELGADVTGMYVQNSEGKIFYENDLRKLFIQAQQQINK